MNEITEVHYQGGHRLFLRFADGTSGELDLAERLRFDGVFAPLHDPEGFAAVQLDPESGTVMWPGGADLCPDVLHRWVMEAAAEPVRAG